MVAGIQRLVYIDAILFGVHSRPEASQMGNSVIRRPLEDVGTQIRTAQSSNIEQ